MNLLGWQDREKFWEFHWHKKLVGKTNFANFSSDKSWFCERCVSDRLDTKSLRQQITGQPGLCWMELRNLWEISRSLSNSYPQQYFRREWLVATHSSFYRNASHCKYLTISKDYEDEAALSGAQGQRLETQVLATFRIWGILYLGVVFDHDEPPDSQHQGVPDTGKYR